MTPVTRLSEGGGEDPAQRKIGELLEKVPDARFSDLELERVWRRLEVPAPPRAPHRWLVAGSMACALVLVAIGLRWARSAAPAPSAPRLEARLQMSSGLVTFDDGVHSWAPAPQGREIQAGDRVRTEADGTALLSLGKAGAVILAPSSEVAIGQLSPATLFNLTSGTVTARVAKRAPDQPFAVQTPRYRVTVVGTVFSVTTLLDDEVEVSVKEGTVEVSAPGRLWRVTAGTSWRSQTPTPSELPPSAAAVLEASMNPSSDLATLFHEFAPPPRAQPTPAVAAVPAPIAAVPSAAPTPTPAPVRKPAPAPGLLAMVPKAEPVAAPATAPAPVPTAPLEPYEEAVRLMEGGQPENAEKLLQQASRPGAPGGGLALYQLGRLRQQRLNDPIGARDAFRRYRAEYPVGPLRSEVDLSLLELALAQKNSAGAFDQSSEFLSAYPSSERADEVRLVRGNLLRERGECAAALEDYQQVHNPQFVEDALYLSAVCHRQLGQEELAQQSLRYYLRRFPAGRYAEAAQRYLGGIR